MLKFQFKHSEKGLNVLLLGAHCDDIEIGCGGTFLKLTSEYKINHVKWVVFASTPEREKEARVCAEFFLNDLASKEIIIKSFRDGFLPQVTSDVKDFYEEIKKNFNPDIVFTHYRDDHHQDHRLLAQLAWNTFRSHLIFEYEIPKYDGDLGNPQFFVEINEELAEKKVNALLKCYLSQTGKHWFDRETFYSIMRLRGMQSACKYAEAFYIRKVVS